QDFPGKLEGEKDRKGMDHAGRTFAAEGGKRRADGHRTADFAALQAEADRAGQYVGMTGYSVGRPSWGEIGRDRCGESGLGSLPQDVGDKLRRVAMGWGAPVDLGGESGTMGCFRV